MSINPLLRLGGMRIFNYLQTAADRNASPESSHNRNVHAGDESIERNGNYNAVRDVEKENGERK
jgi:hypothetical protein